MDSTQKMRSNWSLGLKIWISTQKDEVKLEFGAQNTDFNTKDGHLKEKHCVYSLTFELV
jgi:hypothetical protein